MAQDRGGKPPDAGFIVGSGVAHERMLEEEGAFGGAQGGLGDVEDDDFGSEEEPSKLFDGHRFRAAAAALGLGDWAEHTRAFPSCFQTLPIPLFADAAFSRRAGAYGQRQSESPSIFEACQRAKPYRHMRLSRARRPREHYPQPASVTRFGSLAEHLFQ